MHKTCPKKDLFRFNWEGTLETQQNFISYKVIQKLRKEVLKALKHWIRKFPNLKQNENSPIREFEHVCQNEIFNDPKY